MVYKKPTGAQRRNKYLKYGKALLSLRRRGFMKMGNAQPIFTETFKYASLQVTSAGFPGQFTFTMDELPQIQQYQLLYRKYRILKAQVLIVPYFSGTDANTASYNFTAGANVFGNGRMVYSIDDTLTDSPTTEQSVLENNGCKIRVFNGNIIKINCRPQPSLIDTSGNTIGFRGKYCNFKVSAGLPDNVDHYGINYFITCPQSGTGNVPVNVYYKLTFQLADPQ